MKKFFVIILCFTLLLAGCGSSEKSTDRQANTDTEEQSGQQVSDEEKEDNNFVYEPNFESLDDQDLLTYVKDNVYNEVVSNLNNDDYYVEKVDATYVSKEYLEELEYNSKSNIFFGYSLEDIEKVYGDSKYVFTVDDNGKTVVQAFEDYDDTYEQVIKNVAIGTGVILVCVTVSAVTAGAGAPAVSLIFAASAKTGTAMALSTGSFGGIAAGVVTGIETGDVRQAVKAGALSASEEFKWGAISGAILGGAAESVKYAEAMKALKGADLYLTKQQAAAIQMESGYPTDVISQIHNMDEYKVFKDAHLKNAFINGKNALVRNDIDLNFVDESGATNLERMRAGYAPLDANGNTYELHHIGQNSDATLAILTKSEHENTALHGYKEVSEINRTAFAKQRREFWMTYAKMVESGAIK